MQIEMCGMCKKVPAKQHSNLCESCSKEYYRAMWGMTEEEFIAKFERLT
jgi:hypothetical protein